jgi:hypothetical protein
MNMAEKHQAGLYRAQLANWGGPVLLLLIVSCFYWKLTATDQYTWLDSPDLAYQVLPWWNYQAREWHAGRFPAWEPNQWGGQPLVGQVQPGVSYPLNWLLFLTPLRDGKLRMGFLHWYFVFYHWLAALNCYLFCRYICRSRAAAVLGGCLFALGAAVGNIDWPQMVNGAIWMPLVFLNLLRVRDDPERAHRHAAWAGFWLGLSWLAGHHQIPTFVTYGALATWAWIGMGNWRKSVRPFLLFISVMGLISALQTLPAAEYGPLAKRWVGMSEAVGWKTRVSYHVHEKYGLFPMTLLGTLVPGFDRSFAPFIGAVGLTLAFLGIVIGWRRDERVRWLAGLGILGLLIALGGHSLLHGVLYAWAPLVDKARSPGMAIAVFGFAVAALAALGLDRLRPDQLWIPATRRALFVLSGLIAATFLVVGMVRGHESFGDERAMMTAFVALLLGGLMTWFRGGELAFRSLAACAIFLSLLELANSSGHDFQNVNVERPQRILAQTRDHDDVAAYLRSLTEPVRVEVDDKAVEYNFGDWHGISHFGGYLASLTENLLAIDAFSGAGREIFAVTHYVGKTPRTADEQLVFEGRAGVNVYRRAGWHPRVWTVHTVLPVEAEGLRAAIDRTGPGQVRQAVTLVGKVPAIPFPGPTCGEDRVRLRNYEPSRVMVSARMGCAGVLILGDTLYPGWRVSVDGQPAEMLAAYGVVRGVVVPAGDHEVEFQYRSRSVLWGAGLTLAGLLLLGAVTWGGRRRPTGSQA